MELDEQVEMLSRKIAQLFIELDGWEANDDDPDIFHHTIIWSKKISRMCLEKVVSKSDEKSHSYVMGAAGDLLLAAIRCELITPGSEERMEVLVSQAVDQAFLAWLKTEK